MTHHESLERIIKKLKEELEFELCAVHLVDSNFVSNPPNSSPLVLSLSVMLRIALPHVNVLSKLDLLEKSGALKFDLEFYMNVVDVRTLQNVSRVRRRKTAKMRSHLFRVERSENICTVESSFL